MKKPFFQIIAAALLLIAFAGCRDARDLNSPPVPTDPTRVFVEQLLPVFDETLQEQVETQATGDAIRAILDSEAKRPWKRRLQGGIKYADLFQKIYEEQGYRKAFARSIGLRPQGRTVLEALRSADAHALSPADYHVARIQQIDASLQKIASQDAWAVFKLTPEETETLVRFVQDQGLDPSHPDLRSQVVNALIDPAQSPLPRVLEHAAKFREQFRKTASETAQLELRTADGALRYARDMKHFNLKRMDWRQIRDGGGGKAVIYKSLRATFMNLAGADKRTPIQVLDGLQPPHRQYGALVKALSNYRAIAASGGWPTVKSTALKLGTRSARVGQLRLRLAAEGYLATGAAVGAPKTQKLGSVPVVETTDDLVDQPVLDAIHAYQETHQFKIDDEPTRGFWRSLNTPVERRISQITTSIERWRESRYAGEPDYVFVNIPDFHAEVYEGGERKLRFRVVVGNRKRECDSETLTWVYPNATPVQMAELDHLIVNPYWNVPRRIEDEEIRPEMEKNPDYLEKNDYELIGKGEQQRIRQKPGAKNALGRVKFIFPNRHNTYMHDTPKSRFFKPPIRAFSHGCVRVSEPRLLAEYLLQKEALLDADGLENLIDSNVSKKFTLAKKMPVFFEYYVTRVDDQGRVHFLSDIYRLDQIRTSENPSEAASCRPKSRAKPVNLLEVIEASPPETDDIGP